MTRIVVVGSINMDLVTVSPRFPAPGETLTGERFITTQGGKGANQAVAAARLGAHVTMVGAVGNDAFGSALLQGLTDETIDTAHVVRSDDEPSGTASITVAGGENQIVIVPGANAQVSPTHVEAARDAIARSDAVLVQLEIPWEAVDATLRLGQDLGVPVILNPAPARALPEESLRRARFVTPNQHELAILLGRERDEDFLALMRASPCPVVLTHGAQGAWYCDGGEPTHQPGFLVDAVDSTGAGDTFNAALAVFMREGLASAVRKACAAGALSVSRLGAREGMPRLDALQAMIDGTS